MRFINTALGLMAIALIIGVSFTYFVNRTIFSAKYLDQTARDSGFYTESSVQISKQIQDNANLSKSNQVIFNQNLQSLITPTYIETKLSKALFDGENYLKNGGPLPEIDISDIKTNLIQQAPELKNATIPDKLALPEQSTQNIKNLYPKYQKARLFSAITLAVVLLTILFIGIRKRSFATFATVLIFAGILVLIESFFAQALVGAIKKQMIPFDEFDNLIKSVESILQKIVNDLNTQNITVGFSMIFLAIVLIVAQRIIFRQDKYAFKTK